MGVRFEGVVVVGVGPMAAPVAWLSTGGVSAVTNSRPHQPQFTVYSPAESKFGADSKIIKISKIS